ncbi:MAG TPA: DsbA family protein [Bauldia sp.]|nr:DsbA family protein [Bauldia sp.]
MSARLVALAVVGAVAVGAIAYVGGRELNPRPMGEAETGALIAKYLKDHPDLLRPGMPTEADVAATPAVTAPAATPVPATKVAMAELSDDQRAEVEAIIKNYLIANPEIIRDAMDALQKKEDAAAAAQQVSAIQDNKDLLFSSKRQVVLGNPEGKVTLVEFFDYNCTYCRRAHADMKELLAKDKDLRVVLKEFPVLGEGSVEAAQVAVAVNMVAPEKYLDYHDAMLSERGQVNGERAMEVAEELGIDKAKLAEAMKSDEIKATINEVYDLAAKLALSGTPSYVTPKEVVVGAVGYEALKQKIDEVRCGQPTCS